MPTHPSREHHLVIYHNITMDDFCLLIISWRFTIRGNNLKLRNHSRELITGPRACPLARCTSRRPRHVHVVHWAYFRLRCRRPRPRKKRSRSPLSLSLRSLYRTPATTFAESINALASTLSRISTSIATTMARSWRELAGCVYPSSPTADCCGRIAASSSLLTGPITDPDLRLGGVIDHPRACVSRSPPYGNFPRPTHRDSSLHSKYAMRAGDSSHSLATHFPLSSLTSRSRDKGKDYHLTSSGRRTT